MTCPICSHPIKDDSCPECMPKMSRRVIDRDVIITVPNKCPSCGNQFNTPIGRGTMIFGDDGVKFKCPECGEVMNDNI